MTFYLSVILVICGGLHLTFAYENAGVFEIVENFQFDDNSHVLVEYEFQRNQRMCNQVTEIK